MSESQSSSQTDELGSLFVSVTGDETVTEEQDQDGNDREIREENRVPDAVDDGLGEAIEGAEADSGDPGEVDE